MSKKDKTKPSFLRLRLMEAGGVLLFFSTIYMMIALCTYHTGDPSFNSSGPRAVIHNNAGLLGAYLSDFLLQYFNLISFLIPLFMAIYAVQMIMHRLPHEALLRMTTLPFTIISCTILLQIWGPDISWPYGDKAIGAGGLIGALGGNALQPLLGTFGAVAISFTLLLMCLLWWSGLTLFDIYNGIRSAETAVRHYSMVLWRNIKRIQFKRALQIDLPLPSPSAKKAVPTVERPKAQVKKEASRIEEEKQVLLPLNLSDDYTLPPLHLLQESKQSFEGESESALQQNARQIEQQLANFGVKGEVTKICPGPVITIYELEPAPGVKTSQIVGLANDLARAMSATAIRIAPIPGRSVIGIEMPNHKRRMVSLKELLATDEFETHPGKLTIALGVDTSGHPQYADISKMPHALIAGTTGSGKSVAMNAFILSLVYRMTPEQLRFIMVDPKMLELSIYNDIPHLLTPVITDPNKASVALKWAVTEMERRYRLMADMSVKNIQSFNSKFLELQEKGNIPTKIVQVGFNPETGQPIHEEKPVADSTLPYIVIVLDELADLMMVAGKEVEGSIARLAQMARAAGMHLLIATQRPSVDVITGLIKANVPTRMSFNVTSKIDSRTVLDSMGAEQLLGKGDMLYMENGSNNLARMHGAFVDEDECISVAEHLKKQGEISFEDIFKSGGVAASGSSGGSGGNSDEDPLYREAIEIVAREQKASTSFIQRHLQIGYNRAARLIEMMEADGMISEANHVGKRDVIIKQPPQEGY